MKEKSLFKVIAKKGSLRKTSEIKTSERLLSILHLDDALWTATGVDIEYLSMDKRFLSYLDSDSNGRILCGEARSAIRYLASCLLDLATAFDKTDILSPADIRTDTQEAKELAEAIQRMDSVIQACSDNPDSSKTNSVCHDNKSAVLADDGNKLDVSLATVEVCKRILRDRPVSADGVVLPGAADDPVLRGFLEEIIRSVGGELHPGGTLGVSIPEIDEFLEEARLRLEWLDKGDQNTAIMILGSDTAGAYAHWNAIRSRIADYFELDGLIAIDPSLAQQAAKIPLEAYIRALAEEPDTAAHAAAISRAAAPLAIPDGKG